MQAKMKKLRLTVAAAAAICAATAVADAVRATSPIKVDGRLDEQAWKNAQWETDMRRVLVQRDKGPLTRKTEFAFVYDDHTLYFAMRGYEKDMSRYDGKNPGRMIWGCDPVEIFIAPTGNHFDHYQFAVASRSIDQRYSEFASEGGAIHPDPYAPEWSHAFYFGEKDAWTVEVAIPLSSLYLTRNENWSTTWRVNVTRSMSDPSEGATWSQMTRGFNEPKNFGTMGGFPMRKAEDDFAVLAVHPEVTGAVDGGIGAKVHLTAYTLTPGAYSVKVGNGNEFDVTLDKGRNEVVASAAFPANGRHQTQIVFTRKADGKRFERGYPIVIDYQPIRVKLTSPQYRNNFYPGQNPDRVAGRITLEDGVTGEVVLEGPGFPTRKATITGSGSIDFDTKGFQIGDATLTVKTPKNELRLPVRRLAPSGHMMTWVENGHLVQDGKPVLRRNIYSLGYRSGHKVDEMYEREMKHLSTPQFDKMYNLHPGRVIKGMDGGAAKQDVMPSKEFFAKVDEMIEKAKDDEFLGWYIADEPECFQFSTIFLRHVYDHVAERDPYHVMFIASRGGRKYIECADLFETHPYLAPYNWPDGRRTYGTPPWKMGDYLDAFCAWDRPDKVIGYLPTCFAYRMNSLNEDYPTFDEYRLCTWAAMMRGGKTLWPYAGHDLADRPSLWHGTICIFESFHALEDFILLGKRTTFSKTDNVEGSHYVLPEAEMFVVVNKMPTLAEIKLDGFGGEFMEFRGSRRFKGGETVQLNPLEVIIATTKPYDAGLRPISQVRNLAIAEEWDRNHRDNQLFERCLDIDFESNFVGSFCGTWSKVFDGMYTQLGRSSSWKNDCFIELKFKNGFRPKMRSLRVHGYGLIESTIVSVWKDGKWEALTPADVRKEKYLVTLRFAESYALDRVRLDFPGKNGQRADLEIYEIEIPNSDGKFATRDL